MPSDRIAPYADGTWWPNDHQVSERFGLMCRGNVGEVYPNVVSPLTGSLVNRGFARGQLKLALATGMGSRRQLAGFDGSRYALASPHGGYLYANVSAARTVASRTPGFTVEMVDSQMFGLSGAPAHRRSLGELNPLLTLRAMKCMAGAVRRPETDRLSATAAWIDGEVARLPDPAASSVEQMVATLRHIGECGERMMFELLWASMFAGLGRTLLERALGDEGSDDLINRMTSGLGTIESARPAHELWALGRMVGTSGVLSEAFDGGPAGLVERLAALDGPESVAWREASAAFFTRHGSRGPQEWELAEPSWGLAPEIVLAAVDRLRHAPDDRGLLAAQLAATREELTRTTGESLGRAKRSLFDRALVVTTIYGAQREGTKAACVRLLDRGRRAVWELASRAGWSPATLCLLTIDELPGAMAEPDGVAELLAERAERRDFLQARIPPFWFEGPVPSPNDWELRSAQRRPDASPRTLSGLGVCSGVATGRARVVVDPADPRGLAADEILVAPLTDPAWTPLFLAAAGVVVDVGAHQSHAAIVSRELGIPAVVSVGPASSTIPDGALVTVDGSRGLVHVHGE